MGAGGLVAGGAVAGHVATALPSEASQALAREDSAYAPIAEGVQQVVWSVVTDEPAVALTFDDGPNAAFTPRVLDMLAAVGGRATFFVVGVQVEQERALVRRLRGRGSRARQPHLGPREPGGAHRGADQARDRARHRGDHARRRAATALVPPAPGHGDGLGGAPGPPARPGAGDVERRPRARPATSTSRASPVTWSTSSDPAPSSTSTTASARPAAAPPTEWPAKLIRRREAELAALPRLLAAATERGIRLVTLTDLVALGSA